MFINGSKMPFFAGLATAGPQAAHAVGVVPVDSTSSGQQACRRRATVILLIGSYHDRRRRYARAGRSRPVDHVDPGRRQLASTVRPQLWWRDATSRRPSEVAAQPSRRNLPSSLVVSTSMSCAGSSRAPRRHTRSTWIPKAAAAAAATAVAAAAAAAAATLGIGR